MLDYSIKIKVIFSSLLVVLIITLIFLINYNNSKAQDLEMVAQARGLATSLEIYFDKTNTYPEISKTKLASIQVLTENGFNQEGNNIYFSQLVWPKKGTLVSTKENYAIEFELDNSWDLWNLKGGGVCRISNYLKMKCVSK